MDGLILIYLIIVLWLAINFIYACLMSHLTPAVYIV